MEQVKESIRKSGNTMVMIENCGMENEKIYYSPEEIKEPGYYSLIIIKETH